jgi:2-polyprenyl-3-methyl-5-hydroxy-6-metoxy-1,4-benzoquinol methylase
MQPLLPASGRILAVADGEGRNSVWLAEQGLDVHAIDFSRTAQDKARALARERGVGGARDMFTRSEKASRLNVVYLAIHVSPTLT